MARNRLDIVYRNVVWRLARRAQSLHNRGVWQYAEHVTARPLYLISANTPTGRRVARRIALIIPLYVTGGRVYRPAIPDTLGVSRQLGNSVVSAAADILQLPAICTGEDKIITSKSELLGFISPSFPRLPGIKVV